MNEYRDSFDSKSLATCYQLFTVFLDYGQAVYRYRYISMDTFAIWIRKYCTFPEGELHMDGMEQEQLPNPVPKTSLIFLFPHGGDIRY